MTKPGDILDISGDTGWPMTLHLPPPTNPMAVARELVDQTGKEGIVSWWRGDFYQWTGTHWEVWPDESAQAWAYRSLEHAVYMARVRGEDGAKPHPWAPNTKKVNDLLNALGKGVLQRDTTLEAEDGRGAVAFTNGVLDLDTMALLPHAPARFNLHALPVTYAADAGCPEWLAFLGKALEDDQERIDLLGEWFGYVLCGGTQLQKIFSMFGPKRSGKGTVMRILTALIGEKFVASPATLDSLATNFGREKLISRRLATLGDVQWTGSSVAEAVGILLGISGEDFQTIPRKHRTDWHGFLPTRFMLAGNDRPKFSNASGALAGRMEHLQFRRSFYGHEDPTLTQRLLLELAGIFNWSLVGWRRLQAAGGRFTQTALGVKAAEDVERTSSPVTAFVNDVCVVGDGLRVELDELFREYTRWRAMESLDGSVTKPSLSRNLTSAFPMVRTERVGSARSGRTSWVFGLRLLGENEERAPRTTDHALDQADRALPDDLPSCVCAGGGVAGPCGPGGPCISLKTQYENRYSYESTIPGLAESTRSDRVEGTKAESAWSAWSASAENGADLREPRTVHSATPRSGTRSAISDEIWAPGWDQEPDEPADDHDPDGHASIPTVTKSEDPSA